MTVNRRTVGFNFLEELQLPEPQVSEEQAEQILREHYGSQARAKSLGSQQDRNFTVISVDGVTAGVLKIANPAFNETELHAQDRAAELIAAAEPGLRVAIPLPNVAGDKCTTITGLVDDTAYARLLQYLPGGTLLEAGYLSPTTAASLGEVAGRVSRALAGFTHPGLDRILQWDLRHGAAVVAELISHVSDPARRTALETAAQSAWSRIAPLAEELPRQAVHLDLTDAKRRGVARPCRCTRRRGHRLRGSDGQLGRGRIGDHCVMCAWACWQRPDLGAAGYPGVQRHSTTFGHGGRRTVAAAGAAQRGADRERRTAGCAGPRQRLCHRTVRRRVAHVRAGRRGADGRHDRGDQGRPRARPCGRGR